ncbi:terminase large subunit domain-containing protein [Prescottella equi]
MTAPPLAPPAPPSSWTVTVAGMTVTVGPEAIDDSGRPVWLPRFWTRPIENPDYSEGEALIRVAEAVFRFEASDEQRLDVWQKWLIREILQRYPAGHPRAGQLVYKQVVVSMGRQNGKTVLGAVFALYGLIMMVRRAPDVISLASTVKQAKNLYRKVRFCIENVPLLAGRFKATDRAGISSRNLAKPATYEVMAAGNGDGLQGFSGCLMLLDELHLLKPETWWALVLGASAQIKAMVAGFTTAGDDSSELLKALYVIGRASVAKDEDHDERFGFFLWEADADLELYDPRALLQANPAIAVGRLSLADELATGRNMLESEYRRYRRNEFVSVENTWMPLPAWLAASGPGIPKTRALPLIVSFARSRGSWDRVSVVASTKIDGIVYTELIAVLTHADTEWLERVCVDLSTRFTVEKFVTDVETMKHTILALGKQHHLPAEYLTTANIANATVAVHAMVKSGRLVHAGDADLQKQIPSVVAVNSGAGVAISVAKSFGTIDGVYATVMGAFIAEQMKEQVSPISFG